MNQNKIKKTPAFFISVPSKTFLIGEYAVLEGARAILINTHPRFWFSITSRNPQKFATLTTKLASLIAKSDLKTKSAPQIESASVQNMLYMDLHPQSPAGQWLKKYPEIGQAYRIKVYDPHKGKGGFGFSSAQFNVVYLLGWLLELYGTGDQENSPLNKEDKNLFSLWKCYRELNFQGVTPSGGDVISQWKGEVCCFSSKPFQSQSFLWPFKDLDFFLFRTNVSLSTHEHLKNLSIKKSFSDLHDIAKKSVSCMEKKDPKGFVLALNQYSSCLEKKDLVHPKTKRFLKQIRLFKEVKVARGCGAMGAEIVAVLFAPHDRLKIKTLLKSSSVVPHSHHLTCGLSVCLSP